MKNVVNRAPKEQRKTFFPLAAKKKTIFTLIAALCCTTFISAQDFEIATWEGFRKGAASFTFDDGAPCHISDVAPTFEQYGYRATFYLVNNWNPDWEGFQTLVDKGHEVGSHSDSHPQNMSGEEASSKAHIEAHIHNQQCLTVAYPNCNVPNEEAVMQNYIAGRICNGSQQGLLDIMGKNGPTSWTKVPAFITGSNGISDFKDKMQSAIMMSGWVVFMTHGLVGKNNGNANYSPTELSSIIDALKWAQQNDKDIWIAPLRDVAMYIKERNAAKIELKATTASSWTCSLTHTIADDVCDYNYPLSMRAKNSSNWAIVEVKQKGKVIDSKIDDGYIYFSAIPNGGDIVIRDATADKLDQTTIDQPQTINHKLIIDGQLFIQRGDELFNAHGARVE